MLTSKACILTATVTGILNLPCFSPQSQRSSGFAQVWSVTFFIRVCFEVVQKVQE